ncbi:MAG: mismatch repair protein MutS domain protein [Herbinix sp.]|jgi:dsDNA-specific endonuclease/ATPase MutS2|nr:mismatch repair protein MutS domain protein [Herbinix sp.]
MNKSMNTLEFDHIRNMLKDTACSEEAKQKLLELSPFLSLREVITRIIETTQARKVLDSLGMPPIPAMKELAKILELAEKDAMLIPEQLTQVGQFIASCNRMKSYLKRAEFLGVDIAYYGDAFQDLSGLQNEINQAIRNNEVDDLATGELKDIRRKIEIINNDIKIKLENLLRSKKDWFTDGYVSKRNGHYVLPVKKEYKNQISGSVLDISSTGSTYFMEPTVVMKLEEELSYLHIAEDNEIRKILYTLTARVAELAMTIRVNAETMVALDIIFAKGKLSSDMKAVAPVMNKERLIRIKQGRHPLLNREECVPLDFSIGNNTQGIIITGPNTGGKTVALKTVGLLQIMAQSGLHVPCEEAEFCMNNSVLCDIGDGQSITENLSTFSSHISNIIHILGHSDRDSLILLDELGSGTDPAEGMGIAIAILEELKQKGCLFVATTHYPEIKEYAAQTEGLMNAKMAFDRESLRPLYKLEIGEAGESCALYIAKRLGLPKRMLERAYQEAYGKVPIEKKPTIDDTFLMNASDNDFKVTAPAITKDIKIKTPSERSMRFNIGDSVVVYPQKKIGIVFRTANDKGEVGVQIQKSKQLVSHKRLQLKAPASELYPEDYDFSIIFDTVANRKARHKMTKRYQPDLEIAYEKEV